MKREAPTSFLAYDGPFEQPPFEFSLSLGDEEHGELLEAKIARVLGSFADGKRGHLSLRIDFYEDPA